MATGSKEVSRKKMIELWRPVCPPPKFQWRRTSDFSPELIDWATRNPGPRFVLDGSSFASLAHDVEPVRLQREGGEAFAFRDDPAELVWLREGERYGPVVRCRRTSDEYDASDAYMQALETGDASRAPHTALRGLRSNYDALLFLQKFGTLDEKLSKDGLIEINLADFWRRKALYAAICGIWDAIINDERLRYAWEQLAEWIDEINVFDRDFFDARRLAGEPELSALAGDPETTGSDVRRWLEVGEAGVLKRVSHELVTAQIKKYASGAPSRYSFDLPDGTPIFSFANECKSLWETVWSHFALDSQNGIIWRVCPHCGKVFRPSRRERFFCTAELQREHTKATYEMSRNQRRRASRSE